MLERAEERLGEEAAPFVWLRGHLHLQRGELERAGSVLESAEYFAQIVLEEAPFTCVRVTTDAAFSRFLEQDWATAAKTLERTIETRQSGVSHALLLLGVCYCMLGNFPNAENCFHKIVSSSGAAQDELWIVRKAQSFLFRKWYTLFAYELAYLEGHLEALSQEWLENALEDLQAMDLPEPAGRSEHWELGSVEEDTGERGQADEFCLWLLLRGTVLRRRGAHKEALDVLRSILEYKDSI